MFLQFCRTGKPDVTSIVKVSSIVCAVRRQGSDDVFDLLTDDGAGRTLQGSLAGLHALVPSLMPLTKHEKDGSGAEFDVLVNPALVQGFETVDPLGTQIRFATPNADEARTRKDVIVKETVQEVARKLSANGLVAGILTAGGHLAEPACP
jgi:hypothetical protein